MTELDTGMESPLGLPRCETCGKYSDAALRMHDHDLCGTCSDGWLRSPERRGNPARREEARCMDWIIRRRAEIQHGTGR